MDPRESTARIEPALPAQPAEKAEATEPAEPIDSTEPAEPIDRIDPLEPMLRNESAEPIDHDLRFLVRIPALSQQGATCPEAQPRPGPARMRPDAPGHAVVKDQLRYPAPGGGVTGERADRRPGGGRSSARRRAPRDQESASSWRCAASSTRTTW